ncbi:MAG: hypothetical protein IKA84_03295 [Clostridia bacterium]|nr:hypothetical protein [Clostridia bacterium]
MKIKEIYRKFIVSLKRNPQSIPLVALALSFVYYSFNLTNISQTTALINAKHMGLSCFITMLFSILSFVCLLNAFPKRKKPNIFMIILFAVMTIIIVYCDSYYFGLIEKSTILINDMRLFVPKAKMVVGTHVLLMSITLSLTYLEPVIAKLLKKINTSIEVEDNGTIDAIDITDEE